MKTATKRSLIIAAVIMFIGGAGSAFLTDGSILEIICYGISFAAFTTAFFMAGYGAAKKDLS